MKDGDRHRGAGREPDKRIAISPDAHEETCEYSVAGRRGRGDDAQSDIRLSSGGAGIPAETSSRRTKTSWKRGISSPVNHA